MLGGEDEAAGLAAPGGRREGEGSTPCAAAAAMFGCSQWDGSAWSGEAAGMGQPRTDPVLEGQEMRGAGGRRRLLHRGDSCPGEADGRTREGPYQITGTHPRGD